MHRLAAVFVPFLGLASLLAAAPATEPVLDALVQVRSHFPEDPDGERSRACLGFIVESDGFLLTSYEELRDPASGRLSGDIQIHLNKDGASKIYPARIVGVEPTLNFSVLKIESDETFPVFSINLEGDLEAGEPVYAYHLNEAGETEVIKGSFTALNKLECYQENLTATMLKTEIRLPDSATGAPILDGNGDVFAIHTNYEPDVGILEYNEDGTPEIHLLATSLAMNIYGSIKQRQSLKSPWTGFSVRRLEPSEQAILEELDGSVQCGIGIEHVWKNGPAEMLGIEEGDFLVRFSHYPICDVAEFQKWLYMYGVGEKVKLYFIRNGKDLLSYEYTIEERPAWAKPR